MTLPQMELSTDVEEGMLSIEMDSFRESCCICLDYFYAIEKRSVYTLCCDKKLHIDCLFLLIISGHRLCPLCRSVLKPSDYLNTTIFKKLYFQLDDRTRSLYRENIDILMYRFSYRACLAKCFFWIYVSFIYTVMLLLFFLPKSNR